MSSPSSRLERIRAVARWTETEARVAIEAFRASGLSAEEFGERHGLHPARVLRWAARLASAEGHAPRLPVLLPVRVAAAEPALVEIALGTRIMRVPADLDEGQLARLVRAVESA